MIVEDKRYVYVEELKELKWNKKTKELFIFDIDETLYPYSEKIKEKRREKLITFAEKLGIPSDKCLDIFAFYSKKYGCVLKGLVSEYTLTDWHKERLHNPILGTYSDLEEDLTLKEMLSRLDGTKICFTNGGKHHAREVLKRIGIEDNFELIICCDFFNPNFLCKPQEEAYLLIENVFNIKKENIHFFDDREINTLTAVRLGWNAYTISIGRRITEYLEELIKNK